MGLKPNDCSEPRLSTVSSLENVTPWIKVVLEGKVPGFFFPFSSFNTMGRAFWSLIPTNWKWHSAEGSLIQRLASVAVRLSGPSVSLFFKTIIECHEKNLTICVRSLIEILWFPNGTVPRHGSLWNLENTTTIQTAYRGSRRAFRGYLMVCS